jgi:hypothetical protein
MLDPREQKKGGFGAFVKREHDQQDVRDAEQAQGTRDAATAPKTDAADATKPDAVSAADGAADGDAKR